MPKLGYYVRGDWNGTCDQCGRGYKFSSLKLRWDNAYVCSSCWEPRQPQDFLRSVKDDSSVPVARPRIGGAGGITTTTGSLSPSSTSIGIADTTAFPGSGSNRLLCVIFAPANPSVVEKVSGTYVAGASTLGSVHRGLLGSAALSWASGVTIEYVLTGSA